MIRDAWLLVGVGALALGAVLAIRVGAQHPPGHAQPAPEPSATAAPAAKTALPQIVPRRVTEEEVHGNGGIPRGWKFSVPPGDAARGRELFADLECYKCHEIKTEKFPVPEDGKYVGPELTGMGRIHPAEYIAESILFPNAVIEDEPGNTGPDGLSKMPSYADSLSVPQWLDLVAYLKGLTEGGEHPEGQGIERSATVGDYRIRVVYTGAGHEGHHEHGAGGGHAGHGPTARPATPTMGHLMVFVTERVTGEAVPYLPVSATVRRPGLAGRTIRLRPTIGDGGFHYGADVTLPAGVVKLTVVIGPAMLRVLPSTKTRFDAPVTATFDWNVRPK